MPMPTLTVGGVISSNAPTAANPSHAFTLGGDVDEPTPPLQPRPDQSRHAVTQTRTRIPTSSQEPRAFHKRKGPDNAAVSNASYEVIA